VSHRTPRNRGFEGGIDSGISALKNALQNKMRTMNNEHLTERERQDLKRGLGNVKEVIDPSRGGAVFELSKVAVQ
jgi:hypothetical protein